MRNPIRFTEKAIAGMKPEGARYVVSFIGKPNLYLRVQPTGAKAFWTRARDPNGKAIDQMIGDAAHMPLAEVEDRYRAMVQRIRDGLPAIEPRGETFGDVAAAWMTHYVIVRGLRSGAEYQRILNGYVLPKWRDREFISIRRSDVADLVDAIAVNNGPRQADYVLATIRKLMNWKAERLNDYIVPIAKGLRRVKAKEAQRQRILSGDELAKVMAAAETCGVYGRIALFSLRTMQRLDKVASLKWGDIDENGVWTVAAERREKGNVGAVKLPAQALKIVESMPRIRGLDYVFASGRGSGKFSGFSKGKQALDKASGVTDWVFHDLRRTTRSLARPAGVSKEDAELVMGHKREFIVENYDAYEYLQEKSEALRKLNAMIDATINSTPVNVTPIRGAREVA
jgi:integrase